MSLDVDTDFEVKKYQVMLTCLPGNLSCDGKKALLARYVAIFEKMLRREARPDECAEIANYLGRVAEAFSEKAFDRSRDAEPEPFWVKPPHSPR